MNRLVVVFVAAAMMAGCASSKVSPVNETASLQGAKLRLIERKKPAFSAATAGKVTFGIIGSAAMVAAGDAIVKENEIEDPAVHMGNELAKSFAEAKGMTVLPANGKLATKTAYKELPKFYREADVLLDVQTDNWSFIYFPARWDRYWVIYQAHMRLIDVKTSKLLAEGACKNDGGVPAYADTAPSYDELLADHAARLKQELVIQRDKCLSKFRDQVLMLGVKTASPAP